MPYISYNGQRYNFSPGHTVEVDTGATLTILPEEVLQNLWKIVAPPVSWSEQYGCNNASILIPVYNLTSYTTEEYPAMAFRLGDKEWTSEVMDTSFGPETEGSNVFISSVVPNTIFSQSVGANDVPSLLGESFLTHLKGLVFDFTPGKERVGMVPRVKLRNKSGSINPMFVSGASGGNRNWYGFVWVGMMAGLFLAW